MITVFSYLVQMIITALLIILFQQVGASPWVYFPVSVGLSVALSVLNYKEGFDKGYGYSQNLSQKTVV